MNIYIISIITIDSKNYRHHLMECIHCRRLESDHNLNVHRIAANNNEKYTWYSDKAREDYMKAKIDRQYLGIYAGDLQLEKVNNTLNYHVYFDGYDEQRLEEIEKMSFEKNFQDVKWEIITEGAQEMIIGTLGIAAAGTELYVSS